MTEQRQLPQDRRLLDRFRQGDPEALEIVFMHYSEQLARFLYHGFASKKGRIDGVRNRHDLHDLVAETFRRAFETSARLSYNGIVPYESYLRAIARNLIIDRLRKRTGKQVAIEETPSAELTYQAKRNYPDPSAEQLLQETELARLLKAFVAQLDPVERRFVRLRYQQKIPQRQVAARMSKTRRWVRDTEIKLRHKLLVHLEGTGYIERP